MTPVNLTDPIYHDEDAARAYLEGVRWPDGIVCPLCGSLEGARPVRGDSMGKGWFYCPHCTSKFTVRTGTVYERSHIALHKWVLGFRLMASSKKGVSAHQLHRSLGITYKSAWFMAHRIREAMAEKNPGPMGGEGKVVEADETFHGPADYIYSNERGWHRKTGSYAKPHKVLTVVERGGRARSVKVQELSIKEIGAVLAQVDPATVLHTDNARHYITLGRRFAAHESVNHSEGEYARGKVTTNTVEGFFSIFKRGMIGIYQHCDEQHLQRYLAEFDFRYSNRSALGVEDAERTDKLVKAAEGKRLTYRSPRSGKAGNTLA